MRTIRGDGVQLAGEDDGDGLAVVLLHGLTATRGHVVMRSRVLASSGWRVVAYDARGHGESEAPGEKAGYAYAALAADLSAVLNELGLDRVVLAGASMGAHTAVALALAAPERVSGLVLITPAYDPDAAAMARQARQFDEVAARLRADGIEGFLEAYGRHFTTEPWRGAVLEELRRRMELHRSLDAVADALEQIPRSRPFGELDDLTRLSLPALVIATQDEPDPLHPLALARSYADALPHAELVVEDPGQAPLAWQGGRLSRAIAGFGGRTDASAS